MTKTNSTKWNSKKSKVKSSKTEKKKPRISEKRKKQIASTSKILGKKAWTFLTTEPKKKKSAFDFFN